jgi:hypothetical protein
MCLLELAVRFSHWAIRTVEFLSESLDRTSELGVFGSEFGVLCLRTAHKVSCALSSACGRRR